MLKIILIFYCFIFFNNLSSQDIDSLITQYEFSDGLEKIELARQISIATRKTDFETSLNYIENAIKLALQLKDKKILSKIYSTAGHTYRYIDNYDKSLEYYLLSLRYNTEIKDSSGIANSFNNIGNSYLNMHHYNKAREYYYKSLLLAKNQNDSASISSSYNNIGISYWYQNSIDSSLYYINKSADIDFILDSELGLIKSYNNIGLLYEKKGEYDKSLDYFDKALKLLQKHDDFWELSNTSISKSLVLSNLNKFDEALSLLKEVEDYYIKETGSPILKSDLYLTYSEIYKNLKDYKNALDYYIIGTSLKDSIYNQDLQNKMSDIQKNHEIITRNKYINELSQLNESLEEANYYKNIFIVLLSIISIIVLIISYFYFKKYKENRKLANQLKDSNYSLKELQNIKDKFFTLISHDLKAPIYNLHNLITVITSYKNDMTEDELNQSFNQLQISSESLIIMIDNLINWVKIENHDVNPKLKKVLLNEALTESLSLLNPLIDRKGIIINQFIDNYTKVKTDKLILGLVLRNLISNAIKYSYPGGQITISSEESDDSLDIIIKDYGIGMENNIIETLFNPAKTNSRIGTNSEKGTGLGLFVSQEFMKRLGGNIKVKSKKNSGSEFTISLPLN